MNIFSRIKIFTKRELKGSGPDSLMKHHTTLQSDIENILSDKEFSKKLELLSDKFEKLMWIYDFTKNKNHFCEISSKNRGGVIQTTCKSTFTRDVVKNGNITRDSTSVTVYTGYTDKNPLSKPEAIFKLYKSFEEKYINT